MPHTSTSIDPPHVCCVTWYWRSLGKLDPRLRLIVRCLDSFLTSCTNRREGCYDFGFLVDWVWIGYSWSVDEKSIEALQALQAEYGERKEKQWLHVRRPSRLLKLYSIGMSFEIRVHFLGFVLLQLRIRRSVFLDVSITFLDRSPRSLIRALKLSSNAPSKWKSQLLPSRLTISVTTS